VEARDGGLLISGDTKTESETSDGQYHVRERYSGSFSRFVALPPTADFDQVRAKFDHGVLHIDVNKRDHAGGRSIQIE
jgi:HSP20 family protein